VQHVSPAQAPVLDRLKALHIEYATERAVAELKGNKALEQKHRDRMELIENTIALLGDDPFEDTSGPRVITIGHGAVAMAHGIYEGQPAIILHPMPEAGTPGESAEAAMMADLGDFTKLPARSTVLRLTNVKAFEALAERLSMLAVYVQGLMAEQKQSNG